MPQLRYIGKTKENYAPGQVYSFNISPMFGKVYESSEDKIGKPDSRIMVWETGKEPGLKTYASEEIFYKDWEKL